MVSGPKTPSKSRARRSAATFSASCWSRLMSSWDAVGKSGVPAWGWSSLLQVVARVGDRRTGRAVG